MAVIKSRIGVAIPTTRLIEAPSRPVGGLSESCLVAEHRTRSRAKTHGGIPR
jgi:hypothetical protein